MAERLLLLVWLFGIAAAGPITFDDSKCSTECSEGSKLAYEDGTAYIYSYEVSNSLRMERMEGAPEMTSTLKAVVEITKSSSCEMSLQITQLEVEHGSTVERSSSYIDDLKRNPLPFSWDDGRIRNICPNPEDKPDILNVKRGILSALQNSMKNTWHDLFFRETDVLGTCDTEYKVTAAPPDNPKTVVRKTKNLASCSPHLQGKTAFLATPYDSHASPIQDLPLLSDRELACDQVINTNGIIEETVCKEKGSFAPLSDYGYGIHVKGQLKLQLTSTRSAQISPYTVQERKSLAFEYEPKYRHVDDSEAEAVLRDLCPKVSGLLQIDVGELVHKVVNVIRGLAPQSVENIYNSLKNNELCDSPKALGIYLDALKVASTDGAVQLLTKLTINHEISEAEVMLWLISMPLAGRPDEGAIRAALPLLQKGVGSRQAFLSVSAMAHKYCLHHSKCESVPAIKEVISSLEQFLGNKCHSSSDAENDEIITALKSFGNLGHVGESRDKILDCALNTENGWAVRIAAVEAFRRTPCSETGRAKLLELFSTTTDETEERIAAFLTLAKCPTSEFMEKVKEVYNDEISNQVKAFVWSYFENLKASSDPSKRFQKYLADRLLHLEKPNSTDITKFSRNFQRSLFSEILNIGGNLESNLIFTRHSFLPRSLNMDFSVDFFGYKLNLLELGVRIEDVEYLLEKVFGPRGTLSNHKLSDAISYIFGTQETQSSPPTRRKRATNPYQQKIDVLDERVHFMPWRPQGSLYLRILGNELRWRRFDIKSDGNFGDIDIHTVLQRLAEYRNVDVAHSFMFFDTNILIPSVTGRAYELAGNGSATMGLKAEGKFDIQQPNFPLLNADIDGKFQPSAVVEISVAMTLHSEDYEPGYKERVRMNYGQEVEAKVEIVNSRKLYTKFNFPSEENKFFSLKRDFYVTDQDGERIIDQGNIRNLQFCTKHLDTILGVQMCEKMEVFHTSDASSKLLIPGVRSIELTVRKTDTSVTGYEFIAQMPEKGDSERIYKISIDTPGSVQDRKYSAKIKATEPDSETCHVELQFHTPFYTFDGSTTYASRPDVLQLRVEATGDQKREYRLSLDVEKNIRGARLAEYKPSLILSMPDMEPVVILGTVVFAKGNKEQLSIDLTSDSFGSPFKIKGNFAKEGEIAGRESDCRLATDVTVNFRSGTYRLQGITERQAQEYSMDLRFDYQPPENVMHNIQLVGKINNFHLYRPLSFSSEAELRMSEYPDCNAQLKWDFSAKLFEHLKNDITLRYGTDFEDNSHFIHLKQMNKIQGDFISYTKMNFENELAFAAPYIDFDKSAVFTVVWDFEENPKFILEIGAKSGNSKELKAEINYLRLSKSPTKITTEAKVIYFGYEYAYRDQVEEIAPKELQGKVVIESHGNALVSVDYIYKIKSDARKFHHEIDSTITIPGRLLPIQQKALLKYSRSNLQFFGHIDPGNEPPYVVDIKLNKVGHSEVSLQLPFVEGKLQASSQANMQTIQANFQTKGKDERKIVATGTLKKDASRTLDVEIKFDADKDPQKLIVIKGTSTEAESGDKHLINANINYVGAVNVDISGTVGKTIFLGPHYFRADFSGNMEPTALVLSYQIRDWNLESFLQYLRSDVEKLRADLKGKFIHRPYHLDVEGGLSVVSPFKTFDGKEVYYKLYLDSSGSSRSVETEYRLKYATDVGYVGKLGYTRKRGWPGNIKAIVFFAVDGSPVYEARTELEYGNRKYSFTTNLIPSPKKRFNLDTSFEYAARYANFHHSVLTSFQHLQSIDINAVADLRQSEDLKILSNFNVNNDNLYDVNATLCSRSITDFEGHALLFSKITPSIRIRTKTNNGNSYTKYTLNVQKGDEDIIVGNGEFRKRKKGFNADATLKYRENDIMSLNIHNDGKSQREQNYAVKAVVGSSTYTATVQFAKERRAGTKNTISLCAVNSNKCIDISTAHKETETKNEWSVTYKRADVELNFERIVVRTDDITRYHAVVRSADRVYGYDIKTGREGENKRFSLGLISTQRDMNFDLEYNLNPEDFSLKLGLQSDAKRFPDRKLILHVKSKNTFGRQSSTETEISLSLPVFEKKIEVQILGNLDITSSTPFTAELSADYSTNPDHKLITKVRAEALQDEGRGGTLYVDIYHKDDQHLLVAFETNGKLTADDFSLRMGWKWPAQDEEKQVNIKADWIFKEHKMQAVYNRPGAERSLTAVAVHPPERKTIEIDVEYIADGVTTHSKVAYYKIGDCTNIDFTVPEAGFSHKTEICLRRWSRNLLSIHMVTNEEDTGPMHNSLEIIHQNYGVVKIRNQWNSDFIGLLLYHLTTVVDEIFEALESPPETSEKLKSMYLYVREKIFEPAHDLISRGYIELVEDVRNEFIFFKGIATKYYGYLPPVENLLEMFEPVGEAITEFFLGSLAMMREHFPAVTAYYEKLLQRCREITAFLERYCAENSFCPALINSIVEGSYSGFIAAIEEFILTLPEQITKLFSHSGEIRAWIAHACESVMERLLRFMEPLLQYRYVHDARRFIESAYESLKDQYGEQVSSVINDIVRMCHVIRSTVMNNENVRKLLAYVREELTKLRNELQTVDVKELYSKLRKLIEEYLSNARLPSSEMFYKLNTFNSERGVLDVDLYTPVDISVFKRIVIILMNLRHLRPKEIQYAVTSRSLVANLKRVADFNFFPPYAEQAQIVGKQHFITFDKSLYDFFGECSYLLSRDFDNGNFTLIVKYPERSSSQEMSVVMMVGQVIVEVNTGDKSVTVDERAINLPFSSQDIRAVHEENTVIIDDRHGVVLKCHTVHKLCSVVIPGWYFGKTAGLLGKYNYESYDDFKRPRGHIAQNIANFAKSWEVIKGCKTKNLAREATAEEGTESYGTCVSHFRNEDSPLADCFAQVSPELYFKLCLRHLLDETDKNKALCNVAAAYVAECEKNYLEITLPPKCLECAAPDGSIMKHGERKKFEGSQEKTVDLAFVIENHSCNQKLLRDLNNLARSIDRELSDNGFTGNLYSIVSYGGPEDQPLSHTIRGKTSFNAQDVALTMENFATESKLSSSSSALEALKYAVGFPFRSGSSKTFVLLACTPCKYNFKSLAYPVVQQLLLEHAVNLHVVNNQELQIRKLSARKDIVGVDVETVYSVRDVTQKDLDGEPSLRSQVFLPKDMCVALSQDVSGSFFSSKSLDEATQTDLKNWRSILARRVLKTTKSPECQFCDCTTTKDNVAKTVCHPCTIQRPRLPFTVCKDCNVPRYVEAFASFLLHLAS